MIRITCCLAGLLLVVGATAAEAQIDASVTAIQAIVSASSQSDAASRDSRIRQAAAGFGRALDQWDRDIEAHAERTRRELANATARRAFELHVELGLVYRTRGRLSEAMREFDAAAALDPRAADLHFLRARTLEAADRRGEAASAFEKAWTLDPGNPGYAYHALQHGSLAGDDRARALAVLEDGYTRTLTESARPLTAPLAVIDVLPDWASPAPIVGDERTGRGFAMMAAGRYREAIQLLTILEPAGDMDRSPLAHFRRAQTLEAQGLVSEARHEYVAALDGTLTGRAAIYVAIGRLARVDGDVSSAIDAYRHALRLNPNDPTMRLELANAYTGAGRVDEAFAEIVGGLLLNPSVAAFHAAVGQLRLDIGRAEEAIPAFTRAIELAPAQYELRYALAMALTRLGRSAEAASQLERFEEARHELLNRRRQSIQQEVEEEESIRRGQQKSGDTR